MFSHTETLEKAVVTCSIGEPWDFVSSAGDNVLKGTIEAALLAKDGTTVLLCNVSSFQFADVSIYQVIATCRHKKTDDFRRDLPQGKEISCNFVFDAGGHLLTSKNAVEFLDSSAKHRFLIGGLKFG